METITRHKVQYADTDAYGVVWHGTYLRLMEAGRIEWLLERGIHIEEWAEKLGIVMPVVEVNIKYKSPAKLADKVVLTTKVTKFNFASVTFEQIIKNEESGKVCTIAEVRATAIDKNKKVVKDLAKRLGLEMPLDKEFAVC